MAVLVGTIISAVCDVILEPYINGDFTAGGGPQLGIITEADLLATYQVVITDFLQQAGLVKRAYGILQQFGVSTYNVINSANDVQEVFSDQVALFTTDGFDLDRENPVWQQMVGTPWEWRQDRTKMKSFVVIPAPDGTGSTVYESTGLGGYGTLSAFNNGTISISFTNAGYGTLSADSGTMALLPANLGIGTLSSIIPAQGNLMPVATAGLSTSQVYMGSIMEALPDSFACYIKYGILAKLFSADGELKDNQRAIYCHARYLEGVNMAKAITKEMIGSRGVK